MFSKLEAAQCLGVSCRNEIYLVSNKSSKLRCISSLIQNFIMKRKFQQSCKVASALFIAFDSLRKIGTGNVCAEKKTSYLLQVWKTQICISLSTFSSSSFRKLQKHYMFVGQCRIPPSYEYFSKPGIMKLLIRNSIILSKETLVWFVYKGIRGRSHNGDFIINYYNVYSCFTYYLLYRSPQLN